MCRNLAMTTERGRWAHGCVHTLVAGPRSMVVEKNDEARTADDIYRFKSQSNQNIPPIRQTPSVQVYNRDLQSNILNIQFVLGGGNRKRRTKQAGAR